MICHRLPSLWKMTLIPASCNGSMHRLSIRMNVRLRKAGENSNPFL
ncbi:hypothetical protein HRbin16_02135 [bacterium HR16]|nr:hypothetical protein HRbin16_02135 [bacterium HR16]